MSMPTLPAPKFVERHRMSVAAFTRFRKWESWLLLTFAQAHARGDFGSAPNGRLEVVQSVFYAVHAGALDMAEEAAGAGLLARMPPVPDKWPVGYPVELAVALLSYLSSVPASSLASDG